MESIVDPSADVVWNSVATIATATGFEEKVPRTDEEWSDVRLGAIRLVESANLLAVPGRKVARPGEKSEAPGVELEPEQIEANLNRDRAAWARLVNGLRDAGLTMVRASDARNAQGLFDAGERLELACENCHSTFWYPHQKLPEGYGERDAGPGQPPAVVGTP